MTEPVRPSFGRLVAAFLAAPLVASLLVGMVIATASAGGMGPWLPMAFGVTAVALLAAAPLTVILGVPAYLLLRRRVKARLTGSMIAGAAIAATPWLAVATGGLADVWTTVWPISLLATVGAASGALFWWIAVGPWGRRGFAAR